MAKLLVTLWLTAVLSPLYATLHGYTHWEWLHREEWS